MSDQYYDNEVLNTSVLVEGVVWQPIEAGQNDSFLTADDGCNETQYFSMLESCSNGTILNDISGISELNGYDETVCAVNTAPNLYRIEGSDDLFGYDIACDDEGNVQRYRYRLRLNDNGEYEGDPESIELVTFDSDDHTDECMVATEQVMLQHQLEANPHNILVKAETVLEHDAVEPNDAADEDSNDLHVNEESDCEDGMTFIDQHDDGYESCNRLIDSKAGIIEDQTLLPINKVESVSHCKTEDVGSFEHFDELVDNSFNTNSDHIEQINLSSLDDCEHATDDEASLILQNRNDITHESDVVESHHIYLTEAHECDEPEPSPNQENDINTNCSSPTTSEIDARDESDLNESDAADYEIVEGVHVTGDTDAPDGSTTFEQSEEPLLPAYVLQIPQQATAASKKLYKNSKINYSTSPEKENLATLPQINLVKTNPRSLLKSSYVFIEQNDNEMEKPEVTKIDKRFLKNKEFLQARLFSNYIAQTKILHAPVRQHRLPRKQTFVPVDRNDEEIIVQEVVVSSKGFVETTEGGVVKSKIPLKATEIVHLSDSDDDYKPKRKKVKKKLKPPKEVEIVISDSNDEENNSRIHVVSDSDDVPVKKKRGRPPKITTNTSEPISVSTKMQEPNPTNSCTIRTRWKCENCSKSFPSQGSLKSHMQYHTFHEPKYSCLHCKETFKNNILLQRHLRTHDAENQTYQCAACKKKLLSRWDLTIHKRMHLKDHMVKATMVLKHSPKSTNKSPSKNNVCHFCPKSFSTNDLLKAHQKTHMQFSCVNCPLKFASKLMLESHVRNKCVKSPRRTSCIPRIIPTFKQTESFKRPQSSSTKKALSCDNCTNKFSSYTNLYKHKVLVHNLDTPDKTQIIKEKNVSGTVALKKEHGNIPANEKLRNLYAGIRSKLDL